MNKSQQARAARAFFSEKDGIVADVETIGDECHQFTLPLINLSESGIGTQLSKTQADELFVGTWVYIRSIRVNPTGPGVRPLRIKIGNDKVRGIHACVKWVTEYRYAHDQVAGLEFNASNAMRAVMRKFMDAVTRQAA